MKAVRISRCALPVSRLKTATAAVILTVVFMSASRESLAQGMAVGTGNPTPDASAILDVQSTAKGMLAPRMTTAQRDLIATPAAGLLIYNTDNTRFEFYTGIAWTPIGAGLVLPFAGSASSTTADLFSITNTAATGKVNTLSGFTSSTTDSASGIYGFANSTSGKTFGVFGRTNSTSFNASGVYGEASATSSSGYINGVFGVSNSANGTGVSGFASATTGTTYGGYFLSNSPSGTGVYAAGGASGLLALGNNAVVGQSSANNGAGIIGISTATSTGTRGISGTVVSSNGTAVYGFSAANSGTNYGLYARNQSTSGFGAYLDNFVGGFALRTGFGGVRFDTLAGTGTRMVVADNLGALSTQAIPSGGLTLPYFGFPNTSSSAFNIIQSGTGGVMRLDVSNSSNTDDIFAAILNQGQGSAGFFSNNDPSNSSVALSARTSGNGDAIKGQANGATAFGVSGFGVNGVYGGGGSGDGVTGNGGRYGVYGISFSGRGVYGTANGTTGINYGVYGQSNSSLGYGVYGAGGIGVAGITSSSFGVYGQSIGGGGTSGVYGSATSGNGVFGTSAAIGIFGEATGVNGRAVNGVAAASTGQFGYGVFGGSLGVGGVGVYGQNITNFGRGVYGEGRQALLASGGGTGVEGIGRVGVTGISTVSDGACFYAFPTNGARAADFQGSATINGNLVVSGSVSKGGGSFKIDHPLDPANKYLYHSFVESPDMMNIYNGNVTLNAQGEAIIQLPEWFSALNKDFRYQLTCVGGYSQVYIAEEMQNNCFKIAGGRAGQKVSWQVTGIRKDAWAEKNRIPVEEDKPANERGKYLHPIEQGISESMGLGYEERERMKQQLERQKTAPTMQSPPIEPRPEMTLPPPAPINTPARPMPNQPRQPAPSTANPK